MRVCGQSSFPRGKHRVWCLLIQSAEARHSLKAIVADDLPGRGLVNVISVRGLAEELGPRWPQKQEAVWDYLERSARRHARHAHCLQLNDADFLIALPSGEPSIARSVSLDLMRDVQSHFLGHSRDVRGWVRAIRSLEDFASEAASATESASSVSADSLPADEPNSGRLAPATTDEVIPSASPVREAAHERAGALAPRWESIRTGLALGAGVELAPVWSLKHQAVSSFRMYRQPTPEPLDEREQEDADIAAAERLVGRDGLGLLREGTAVHLPVSVSTLLLQRSRVRWLAALSEHRHLCRARVLLEVEGSSAGVLESRLREIASVVRPFFRVVLLEGAGAATRTVGLRLLGFDGAAIDLTRQPLTWPELGAAVRRVRASAPIAVVHGVTDADFARLEVAHGATHASAPPTTAQRRTAAATVRQDAAELTRVLKSLNPRPSDPD